MSRRSVTVERSAVWTALIAAFFANATPAQWLPSSPAAAVNSSSSDFGPSPAPDGLALYFTSDRPGGIGDFDIHRATRSAPYAAFGAPAPVNELNSTRTDAGPSIRGDGLEIFFYSSRLGGIGGLDLWRATRPNKQVPFSRPVNLTPLNTSGTDAGPSVTEDGLLLFFASQRPGGLGGQDIWMASRTSIASPFGAPALVARVNSSFWERDPKISADGLTLFFSSNRVGGFGRTDTWMVTRLRRSDPFSPAVNLGANINGTTDDIAPGSWRRNDELFYCSDRNSGRGSYDIFSSRFVGVTGNGAAGPGRVITLNFSAPAETGRPYFAAASFGNTPGIAVGTRVIPLNPDPLLFLSAGGAPPIFGGFAGGIGPDGTAQGRVAAPNDARLIGVRIFVAFVTLDAAAPSGIGTISNALPLLLQ